MPETADRSTTPAALRAPVLAGLGLVAAYFAACFLWALDPEMPGWVKWGNWQMFSEGGTTNSDLGAEASIDGEWVPVDLTELFPSRFESGPRYRQLRNRAGNGLQQVADAACDRHPSKPDAIRLLDVRWRIVPGEDPYLRKGKRVRPILEWRCAQSPRRPRGRRL